MLAHELIADESRFCTGALARDASGRSCGTLPDSGAVSFDALGAIFWCYPDPAARQPIAKRLFDLCQARFGHRMLGKLGHEDSVSLLMDAGA